MFLPKYALALSLPVLLPLFALTACDDETDGSADAAQADGASHSMNVDARLPTDLNPSEDATADTTTADVAVADAAVADAMVVAPALRFDGIDDRLLISGGVAGFNENAFSEEAWFRTNSETGVILEVYSTVQTGADRAIFVRSGVVCFYVYAPTRTEHCTTARYDDGVWHHAAGTLGPGGMTLYLDGAIAKRDANTRQSAFNWDNALRAGYGHIGADAEFRYLNGALDEIRVWNVERSETEIRDSYRRRVDPATAGLAGYWPLDERGSATTAPDATVGKRDGTLAGFATASSPWITDGVF